MKRLKGPELKMPELKTPDFLTDLYYDLRDRRLLPVLALVLVAIAAVPFLLGSSEEAFVPPPSAGLSALGSQKGSSKLTVVEATPGLREYRKRLVHRSPTDPFKQRYTGLPASAQLQSGGEGSSSGGEPATVTSTSTSTNTTEVDTGGGSAESGESEGSSNGAGAGAPGTGTSKPPLSGHYFAYRPDVRFGIAGSHDLALHNDLPIGELLPKKNPVAIFLGVSQDGQRVSFDLIDVAAVNGPGRCIPAKRSCNLLILHAGQAVNIVSGTSGQVFRLAIGEVEFVEVDPPKPANSSSAGAGWAQAFGQSFSK